MRHLIVSILMLLVSGCATNYGWSVATPGCYNKGLQRALFAPEATDLELTDIRIGKMPDTGQGPGLLVQFDRKLDPAMGTPLAPPQLIIGVGDWERSCVIVIPEAKCPPARDIYAALSRASVPVGFAFDSPSGINIFHGTQYFLLAEDGQHNNLQWSYYGPGHPLQAQIDEGLTALESCAKAAHDQFHAGGL
jgi:hypothetical protein